MNSNHPITEEDLRLEMGLIIHPMNKVGLAKMQDEAIALCREYAASEIRRVVGEDEDDGPTPGLDVLQDVDVPAIRAYARNQFRAEMRAKLHE